MSRIKILFTIPNFDTAGSGKVVFDLVKELDKNVFAPEICCNHDGGDFFEEIKKLQLPIHFFKVTADYRPLTTLPIRIIKIVRFFKMHHFDIIHSWHWSSDFTEPLAAKIAGIPFVYTKKAMGWGNKAWQWRSKLSSKIIAINKDMIKGFLQPYHHKTVYIPLGVDLEKFYPLPKDITLLEQLKLSENDFIILTVANLVEVKGIEILLEAVLKLNNAQIKVLIVGADHSDYANHLKTKYNHENFQFLGKKNDVRPYISVADLFVIPTLDEGRKEGLPIAPLEAMAMGKTAIGSNISGVKDLLEEFPDYLFKAGDVNELANLIGRLNQQDKDTLKTRSSALLRTVEKSFSLPLCLQRHSDLYCSLHSTNR
ncbi:Glycosyltransferase involved in cell wall bisynthesis [Flavobacteriaceae bacterium MAR_2010_188]|nr:Glycosyltransferase involved in cell wall bisynthesis [Flavobacteriaceae bacterium MAR_2010_188]